MQSSSGHGDWELDPRQIALATHDDGALVELGSGGFGTVSALLAPPAASPETST